MSGVKRYDAVHIRYEENNIRYGEGCEVEMVTASDYDRIKAELDELRGENESYLERIGDMAAVGLFDKLGTFDQLIAERDELRAQVEAMRRLLADEHLCGALTIICQLGVVERCRCWSCRMKRIDAALQAKP